MDYVTPGTFVNGSTAVPLSAATMNAFDDGIIEAITKAEAALGSTSGVPGIVQADSFAGASDAAKMSAALSYAAAQTYRPWVQLPARTWNTGSSSFDMYNGMKICGPGIANAPKNPEAGGGMANQTGVWQTSCGTGANSLIRSSATVSSVAVCNVSFYLPGNASQVFRASGGNGCYPSVFHNLNMYGGPYFFGNPSEKFLTTQMVFSGHWQMTVNNDTPITLGGGDCSLWMAGYANIDGTQGSGAGKPVVDLQGVGKSNVGCIYMTARTDWTGIRIQGGPDKTLSFFGGMWEGQSQTNLATRPVIDQQGATVNYFGLYTGQVSDLTSTALGVIHQSGGQAIFHGGSYYKGSGVSATFPWLYQTGGTAQFRGIPMCAPTVTDQIRVRWSDGTTTTFPAAANSKPFSVGAAATDAASTQALANNLRTALINAGLAV